VANTGISAVVDPRGRVIKSLPLGTEGVIDSALPTAKPPPRYARAGDGPIGVVLGLTILWLLRARRANVAKA
jgi:apolipoprotein N-acyltransferase